jgi:DNA (cytosine-5)-methyltransferase 1
MRAGTCFTGIGGFDIALERLGFEVAWQVENDADCNRVLSRHWPLVPRYGDIREVTRGSLEATLGDRAAVDVLVGGWPCQDLSVAGYRAGLAGSRSRLFYEFARLIGEIAPAWVVAENVPGLLSSGCDPPCPGGCVESHGGDMGAVIGTLAELGYGYAWRVLDAQFFGVPQLRRRVFIVGHLGEPWSAPAQVLFESEGSSGPPASSGQEGAGDDAGAAVGVGSSREVVAALTSNGVGTCGADDNQAQAGHLVVGSRFGSELARPLTAAANGPHYDYDTENFVISDGVRRLTPIECERLQGFPDDWTLPLHDSPRYRVLGNAVAVPVVEWVLRRLGDHALQI